MVQRKQQPFQLICGQQPFLGNGSQRLVDLRRNLAADLLAEQPVCLDQPVHYDQRFRMRYTRRPESRCLRPSAYIKRLPCGVLPVQLGRAYVMGKAVNTFLLPPPALTRRSSFGCF
ncbi:hypothetical protein D3C80_1684990 [compost metagenome]